MGTPTYQRAPSKAQQFATKAEAIGGWVVERSLDKTAGTRAVTATRGDESFYFCWIRNENGRDNFLDGVHVVEGVSEDFTNVKEALRLMAQPEGSVRIVHRPASRTAVELNQRNKLSVDRPANEDHFAVKIVRLPFDPYVSSANEIIAAVLGARVTWINSMSGNDEEGVCSREAKQIKVEHLQKDLEDWSRRILTFCSEDGFRSVRLCAITGVK